MTPVYLWVSELRGLYCGRPGVEAFALQASGGALPVQFSKGSMCLLHVCVVVVPVRLPQAVSVGLHTVTPVAEWLPRSSLFARFFGRFALLVPLCVPPMNGRSASGSRALVSIESCGRRDYQRLSLDAHKDDDHG